MRNCGSLSKRHSVCSWPNPHWQTRQLIVCFSQKMSCLPYIPSMNPLWEAQIGLVDEVRPRKHFNATWSVNVFHNESSLNFSLFHFLIFKSPHLSVFLSSSSLPTYRLEQGISLRGCLRREWWVLQRRGPHELWPRGRSRKEAGEPEPGAVVIPISIF